MKSLSKQQFVPFLKNISTILDGEEINHEIPFCHIDKMFFNHIDIIIPDYVASFDIGKLFNCSQIKEKKGIINTIIDDVTVNFIKTKETEWVYTFYYYSWNVLPVLLDVMAYKSFGLRYTRNGLKYKFEEKILDITQNMQLIFEFFDLKFHMLTSGFATDYVLFSFIESSSYFDYTYFDLEIFEEFDPSFNLNKHYYESFIQHMPRKVNLVEDEKIIIIDAYFPKSNFLEKLSKIQLMKENPDLKEKDIIIKQKSIEQLKQDKEKEIKTNRKKIKFRGNIDDDLTYENF